MLEQGTISLPFMQFLGNTAVLGVNLDQAPADVGVFIAPFRCKIKYAGGVVTATCGGVTTTPVVGFDRRPTAGSDASRGSSDIGSLALGTTVAGRVMYDAKAQNVILEPGQEVICKVTVRATGVGAAGHIRPFMVVEPLAETMANLSRMVKTV